MNGQQMADNEPGAVENRLSLNPSDERWADTVGKWKDGEQYMLSLEVRQISPGEFEVLSAEAHEETPTAETETSGTETAQQPAGEPQYPNPAVRRMMTKGYRG